MSESQQHLMEIFGLLSSAALVRSVGEDHWTLRLNLQAWRPIDGPLHPSELAVSQGLPSSASSHPSTAWPMDTIVRARLDPATGNLLGGVAKASDPVLAAHAQVLAQPVTIQDPDFGCLTLDRRTGQFFGSFPWSPHRTAELSFHRDSPEMALQIARDLLRNRGIWNQRIFDYIIEELLPVKNDGWLDENEPLATVADFQGIQLESISISSCGRFDFFFDAGELFWGHLIEIRGTLDEGLSEAGLCG